MKSLKEIWKHLYLFFPINLLALHFKKNQVLLLFWLFFFASVSGQIGKTVGLHYLYLDPEYLGYANFSSFFITGLALGIFIISFFITSYIVDGHRYKFIVMDKHPFATYSLNNSFIPFVFVVFYSYKFCQFQLNDGQESWKLVVSQLFGLILGIAIILFLVITYFTTTNRSALKDLSMNIDASLKKSSFNHRRALKNVLNSSKGEYRIKSYLIPPFVFKEAPHDIVVDKEAVNKVFDQNHLNAVLLELVLFLIIMSLGFYKDFDFFKIPAGASSFLFFAFLMMFVGALFYWMRAWALSVVVVILLAINGLMKNGYLDDRYEAFGLEYHHSSLVPYNKESIREMNSRPTMQKDEDHTIKILENWKAKFDSTDKPKMVIITSSGGGQRSAVWTTCVLNALDKQLNKKLMKHATLITGASGGVLGSSYYRELYLRDQLGELNLLDEMHIDNISKDILNPMVFAILVNDFLFRYQKFEYKGKSYSAGRGYAFENTINKNVNNILDKSLADYGPLEYNAKIPMVVLAPTIANDSRKLFISSQPVSYMNKRISKQSDSFRDRGVDFLTLFQNRGAEDLRFLTALRMSATFPYITPNIHLPTSPNLEIMDAGLSDNFGTSDALKYLDVFKDWINKNTSGVILVSIRDKAKDPAVQNKGHQSLMDKVFNPIDVLYTNWDFVQDNSNDQLLEVLSGEFDVPIDVALFQYNPDYTQEQKASLSWHLTSLEKESIKKNILETKNQESLNKVVGLLK